MQLPKCAERSVHSMVLAACMALAACTTLAVCMALATPHLAYAHEGKLGLESARPGLGASPTCALRAVAIDDHADAFEPDGIIVVYRDDLRETPLDRPDGRTQNALVPESGPVLGVQGARAELLSENAAVEGGGVAARIDLPAGISVGQAVAAAEADPRVAYAQPIYRYRLLSENVRAGKANALAPETDAAGHTEAAAVLPNDPALQDVENTSGTANQWWIPAVNAPTAWETVHGDDNDVAVAVLDTGVNFNHPDLKANLLAEYAYDACNDRPLTESPSSEEMAHGSHVAGIVAAEANNGIGIAGVSYNAKVLPICVFRLNYDSSNGYERALCTDEDLIRAYDYLLGDEDENGQTVAEEANVHVVNMSLGGYIADDPTYEYDYLFEAKIEQAQDAGILTVAAGGNGDGYGSPRTDPSYPCDFDAVMAVIALQDVDRRATWSDYSAKKDISAPGCNIYSTWYYGNTYHMSDGTSMASPIVAGCAALLWAYDPSLSVADVKDALYSTADDLGAQGFDPLYGWGRVNVGAAVSSLGTASLKAERATMAVTATQQLSAAPVKDPSAMRAWKWTVSDPAVARVSQNGVLTALAPGKVEVVVETNDRVEPALSGRRTIEVVEMSIPGGVSASANPGDNSIALRWKAAEAAVKYRISRSNAIDGAYDELGTFDAAELTNGDDVAFVDCATLPAVPYWYKVAPLGVLDGADRSGIESVSNRGYYTDKVKLRLAIAAVQDLLDATKVSESGNDLPVTEYWTSASARAALNAALSRSLTVFWSGSASQEAVDAEVEALDGARATFEGSRAPGAVKLASSPVRAAAVQSKLSFTYNPKTARRIASSALFRVADAHGSVTFAKESGPAGIVVSQDGSMTLEKGLAVGTHVVHVKVASAGDDVYEASSASVTLNIGIAKAANTINAKGLNPTVSFSKKSQVVSKSKAYSITGAKGALSFAKVGKSKLGVNKKTGNITVPKSLKRGTYSIKVNVTAAGDKSYKKATKAATVKVRVK